MTAISPLQYDRRPFRDLVLMHLGSDLTEVRAAALAALATTGDQSDLSRVLSIADDPSAEVRIEALRTIVSLAAHDLTDLSVRDSVVRLLAHDDANYLQNCIRALAHTSLDDRLEGVVIEFTRRTDLAESAFGTLSTLPVKSTATVSALLELLESGDPSLHGTAVWGLKQGIPAECHGVVADAFARFVVSRQRNPSIHESLLMLAKYGTVRHAPVVEGIAANEMADDGTRRLAGSIGKQLRQKH